MSKRRLVNRCLMGAVLAVPATLFGIYSLGFAEDPPIADFPAEAELRPILRVAQADEGPNAGGAEMNLAALDVPGGMGLGDQVKDRITAGLNQCANCHSKSGAADPIPGLPDVGLDDGWCLLNEVRTFATLDKHFTSYAVLLNERSQRMGELLGIVDENGKSLIHRDQRCLACHSGLPIYEMDADAKGLVSENLTKELKLNRGVSCEGCHGPSKVADGSGIKGWYDQHYSTNWRYMPPKEKADEYGFYDVRSPVSRTRMCASCHIGNAHEGRVVTHEMYAAGHPPLPGFELETFSDQEPQHWRDFRHKPEAVRKKWLEETADWRKNGWTVAEFEDTRDMLVAACVSLAEYVRLNSNLADEQFQFPLQSDHWQSETWPEFAQFACYACHHDLQAEGWRLMRTPVGTPGRPTLYEWPMASVELALRASKLPENEAKMVRQLIHDVQLDAVDGPFGHRQKLIQSGRDVARELYAIAHELESKPFARADAVEVLHHIADMGQKKVLDYDSARQLVWAYRIAYEELNGTAPSVQDLYDTGKSVDQVLSWYGDGQNLDEIQRTLAEFDEIFLLNLRAGRVKKETVETRARTGVVASQLNVLEWQANLALPQIGDYAPREFQKKMSELQTKTKKAFPQ